MRLLTLPILLLLAGLAQAADVHRIVVHVDDADPERQNLVLNNVSNLNQYYLDQGEEAQIEIVTYGPGLTMLIDGKSPVADRVASIAQNYDNVTFSACANTLANMTKKTGKEPKLLPQAKLVPSGVIELAKRQEEGWSYLRP